MDDDADNLEDVNDVINAFEVEVLQPLVYKCLPYFSEWSENMIDRYLRKCLMNQSKKQLFFSVIGPYLPIFTDMVRR